jgi:colicin import membrane protein
MADETDGVGESFDDSLRIALTVASQFGERISRLREQMSHMREAAAQQEYRELQNRFEAERGAARASLEPVRHAEWWDSAKVDDIALVHETATVWRDHDDVAREAGDTIRREVQDRYGIDVDAPGGDPAQVAAALREAEKARADARAERERSAEELTASQILFANAERREREAQEQSEKDWNTGDVDGADIADFNEFADREADWKQAGEGTNERSSSDQEYDSSERRQDFASSLEKRGIAKETIAARILADGENAKHPREAVKTTTRKAPKRRGSSPAAVQHRERGGLTR